MVPPARPDEESVGPPVPDYSPEARRREVLAGKHPRQFRSWFGFDGRAYEVARRVVVGTINDGTIHAGNLAYMSVLAIFPFFITGAAIFAAVGEESERMATVSAILTAFPPMVRNVIEPVARDVIEARSGWLLWAGGIIGLWTVGSLIETIRDILRRAYGTQPTQAFWKYRIGSVGIIIAAVLFLIFSLFLQVTISTAQVVISTYLPQLTESVSKLGWSRMISALALYGSIWMLFIALTPSDYRGKRYPKWPGAVLVTIWWLAVTMALPPALRSMFAYDLTYGSLAGFMIALFFFWLVGLGMVAGAELNAALAETPEEERDRIGQAGVRALQTDENDEEDA